MQTVSGQPNRIDLKTGHILFDHYNGEFRVAYYDRNGNRFTGRSSGFRVAVANALGCHPGNKKVRQIANYIRTVPKYEGLTLE